MLGGVCLTIPCYPRMSSPANHSYTGVSWEETPTRWRGIKRGSRNAASLFLTAQGAPSPHAVVSLLWPDNNHERVLPHVLCVYLYTALRNKARKTTLDVIIITYVYCLLKIEDHFLKRFSARRTASSAGK